MHEYTQWAHLLTALFFSKHIEVEIHGVNFDPRYLDRDRWCALFVIFRTQLFKPLPNKHNINYVITDDNALANYERIFKLHLSGSAVTLLCKYGKISCFQIGA